MATHDNAVARQDRDALIASLLPHVIGELSVLQLPLFQAIGGRCFH